MSTQTSIHGTVSDRPASRRSETLSARIEPFDSYWQAPALAIYPGLLIFVTVIAFNFLGDGLQDALDPRAEEP